MDIDKSTMRHPVTGAVRTQSLFLEPTYETEVAVYTLKDNDHTYEGKVYPSLKKLYIGEYEFATTYFLTWKQWQRITNNKAFTAIIEDWRMELEAMLRGRAIATITDTMDGGGQSAMQASKWIADRGWEKRPAGRPSKDDVKRETEIQNRISNEYSADIVRLRK